MCELTCPSSFYEDDESRKCVSTCPSDPNPTYYYDDATSDECVEVCPGATLADPTTMSCITTLCPTNPSLFAYDNKCIDECPSGMYSNSVLRTC